MKIIGIGEDSPSNEPERGPQQPGITSIDGIESDALAQSPGPPNNKLSRIIARGALGHLKYNQSRALELKLGLGDSPPLSTAEIAQQMGISSVHARRLVREARIALGPQARFLEKLPKNRHPAVTLEELAESLSLSEFEMLEMIVEGRSMTEIGHELGLGGWHGAIKMRDSLADRLGVTKEELLAATPEIMRLANEAWEAGK